MNIQIFSIENNSSQPVLAKVSHSVGDCKNVKTPRQCMSLTEKKLNFFFLSIPYFLALPLKDRRLTDGVSFKTKLENYVALAVSQGANTIDAKNQVVGPN